MIRPLDDYIVANSKQVEQAGASRRKGKRWVGSVRGRGGRKKGKGKRNEVNREIGKERGWNRRLEREKGRGREREREMGKG